MQLWLAIYWLTSSTKGPRNSIDIQNSPKKTFLFVYLFLYNSINKGGAKRQEKRDFFLSLIKDLSFKFL